MTPPQDVRMNMVNPKFSQNIKANIGKLFAMFVRKHFPKNNKCHKILILKILNLSCCYTTNVRNIIKQHNSRVFNKTNEKKQPQM